MFKKNVPQLLASSLLILLPMVFGLVCWNALPETVTTHWGVNGSPDGMGSKAFLVFGMPLLHLLAHWLCLGITLWDAQQREQSRKALRVVYWILPCVCLFTTGLAYSAAFGREVNLARLTPAALGVLFVVIGNVMPKMRRNHTLGIRVTWTIYNEENWNKTHRLGGKVWVICGLCMLFSVLLPGQLGIWVMVAAIAAMAVIPIGYSYWLYRMHRRAGIVYAAPPVPRWQKIAGWVFVAAVLLFVAVLLFTGDITAQCGDDALNITASYWQDASIPYEKIESISYREDFATGTRTNGFGSLRLLMGNFQNGELGAYTLYAYTGADAHIVLTVNGRPLVVGLREKAATRALYEQLQKLVLDK